MYTWESKCVSCGGTGLAKSWSRGRGRGASRSSLHSCILCSGAGARLLHGLRHRMKLHLLRLVVCTKRLTQAVARCRVPAAHLCQDDARGGQRHALHHREGSG